MSYRAQRYARKQGTVIHEDSRTQRLRTRMDAERAAIDESADDIELADDEHWTKHLPWVHGDRP